MKIGLLGKSKLGFVDGRFPKFKFDLELHDQWEKVNVVVLSWIMNAVNPGLLSSVVYASNAHKVWEDLKERFDKVNGSRVLYVSIKIHNLTQGTLSVDDYFSKLRDLWDEFDAIMPCPGCPCPESKKYAQHFEYHRLLQFLMGLNESYSQSRSQIMMKYPIPSINKAYSLLIDQESQRSLANFTQTNQTTEGIEGAVFYINKNSTSVCGNFKFRKNQVQCDYCHYKGHTKENCYKLHGYPSDFKGKKKGQNSGVYSNNVSGLVFPNATEPGNQQGVYGTQSGIQQVQHAYMPQFAQTTPNNSHDAPFFTKEQYQ
ncbi:uncharacterized protein LOC142176264 [Nicotiana tabacum]|uniref:Uncharacterized protein LOC142176264 n=1 Tax=Nicotiana tabacum TaxID=4097 RepID=A0AC58TQJ7_TOBAC